MKKILVLLSLVFALPAFAEKIPIKITPTQIISTHHDEIDIGDWLYFETTENVYRNGKVFIKSNTPVIAIVDYVHENGLFGDNAQIKIKKFKTKDTNGNILRINYPVVLDRKHYITRNLPDKIVKHIGVAFKGSEIFIEPDTIIINIFLQ